MTIRTFADIEALAGADKLTEAEQLLLDNCEIGARTILGDGKRPSGRSPDRTIRADLLRYLILGGCDGCQVHQWGVNLQGAWIAGPLDLSFATAKGATLLINCGFEQRVEALQARFELLTLTGSALQGFNAQGIRATGDVRLEALNSTGEVSLSGAEIGGQLDCEGAELNSAGGQALNAQGVQVTGGVFLQGLKSTGVVSLSSAEIGSVLTCEGAELDGGDGKALNAQRLVVKQSFFWRRVKSVKGFVDLTAAHLGDLVDDAASWDEVADGSLVGLTYDNLIGPLDLEMRKAWLKKGAQIDGSFYPQPYQQLARFYRETGHRREARDILIEKEIQQRRAARELLKKNIKGWDRIGPPLLQLLWSWTWDVLSRRITGYGYKPLLSLAPLLTLIIFMAGLSLFTWRNGDFAPNSDVILMSQNWIQLAENAAVENPADQWGDQNGPGRDYETFNALAYGADVVVPILDLGQTDAWAPSTSRGVWGKWLFGLQKIFVILGWGVTAIVAAAVTGMIRRDD